MTEVTAKVKLFLNLAKIQAILTRRFDNGLGGLGFNEFIILFQLSLAEKESLRRIDLAEKIGLTASGVTRLLLPMEKVGLVTSGASGSDARVRSVKLAPGGKRKLSEAMERAEFLAEEILELAQIKDMEKLRESIAKLANSI